jgi:ribosomal protein S18 acetylase RimI-like enzyme
LAGEDVTVRAARREDLDAVLRLWREARSAHASTADRREDVERLLDEASPAALIVAERQGRLVGAVIAGWDGWRGNVYRLAVDARHRREGIATRLLRAAEEHFRSRGALRVTALVARGDGNAEAFWDAAGYPWDERIGRRVRNI